MDVFDLLLSIEVSILYPPSHTHLLSPPLPPSLPPSSSLCPSRPPSSPALPPPRVASAAAASRATYTRTATASGRGVGPLASPSISPITSGASLPPFPVSELFPLLPLRPPRLLLSTPSSLEVFGPTMGHHRPCPRYPQSQGNQSLRLTFLPQRSFPERKSRTALLLPLPFHARPLISLPARPPLSSPGWAMMPRPPFFFPDATFLPPSSFSTARPLLPWPRRARGAEGGTVITAMLPTPRRRRFCAG